MGILDSDTVYTLRPMKYPKFYENYKTGKANNWDVNEVSFNTDMTDIREKLSDGEKHAVGRLVAFFATGDNIVNDNLTLHLMRLIKASPELGMYYSLQTEEEARHIDFYLTLLDNYLPDESERFKAFAAIENIPSIKKKADFCFKWMDQMAEIENLESDEDKKTFLLNLITFASAVEGLFFMAAFSYVYYLRDKGLLHGLASGTNWVFRDETCHMNNAFDLVDTIRQEYPNLWDEKLEQDIRDMLAEAIDCEAQFADDILSVGLTGFSRDDLVEFLKYCADNRMKRLGMEPQYNARQPFHFMELQDLSEQTNFFERTVAAYQVGVSGDVGNMDDEDF